VSHYDRDADIAALDLEGFEGASVYGEDREWGLILRDRKSNAAVGFEFWRASELLPADVLDALPSPQSTREPVERQTA
jgi:hypothetical protein